MNKQNLFAHDKSNKKSQRQRRLHSYVKNNWRNELERSSLGPMLINTETNIVNELNMVKKPNWQEANQSELVNYRQ